jgi:hypothetical protein
MKQVPGDAALGSPAEHAGVAMRILLCLLFLATSPAAAQPVDRDEASLISFADAFDQAQLAKDGAALEKMV